MSEGKSAGLWAAQLNQDTYREGDRRRDEQFMENALLAWLETRRNQERFLAAFDVDVLDAGEISVTTQLGREVPAEGRSDLTFHFRDESFRVELKLWAGLTPAQRGPAYADVFIVPQGRVSSVRRDVEGVVIGWEALFDRLAVPSSPRDPELERLSAFYDGMAYGTHLVEWPADLDLDKLVKLRATARSLFRELRSTDHRPPITWDPVDWFTCTLRDSGDQRALDLKEDIWWWVRQYGEPFWEPDEERDDFEPDLAALARAMGSLWRTVVRAAFATGGDGSSVLRWDEEWGLVFGRYFWCGEHAIEVLLSLGDHPDARLLGLVAWTRNQGRWEYEHGAWWPDDASTPIEEWRKEAVTAAIRCSEGTIEEAFGGALHAVMTEYE
ncbi:hypothetical protein SB749_15140 [Brevibacterium sp. SIMBA_078]|uniref:hypothetical protein n=1 Tax=Brevibacterium sp. SIMBA_078 TaxID=3085816 RepID=UPI00397C3FCC